MLVGACPFLAPACMHACMSNARTLHITSTGASVDTLDLTASHTIASACRTAGFSSGCILAPMGAQEAQRSYHNAGKHYAGVGACGVLSLPEALRARSHFLAQAVRPRAILDLITSAEQLRLGAREGGKAAPVAGTCQRCGYISSQAVCKACLLLEGLNRCDCQDAHD